MPPNGVTRSDPPAPRRRVVQCRVKEFSLLSEVYRHNPSLGERVIIPPGDDMGMVRLDGRDILVAVDQVIGDQHVRMDVTPLRLVGRKAVARSLSDVAAMAGRPVGSLVAVTLPGGWDESRAMELFEGMRETAAQYHAPLIGGDIAISRGDQLVCSVTVFAEPGPRGAITRGGGRVGDYVFVTGELGGSFGDDGRGHHLTFEPRIDLALALARRVDVHAMIDISDGLGRDLDHIAEMSKVTAEIDVSQIPVTPGSTLQAALGEGEDYELCFTAAPDAPVPDAIGGVPITRIGRLTPPRADGLRTVVILNNGEARDAAESGWEHHGR